MKTWLQITFLILWSASCFIFGYMAKRSPTPIIINPAQSVTLNGGENKALKERLSKDSLKIVKLIHQKDSLQTILNKKNETKIIFLDTVVSTDMFEWAKSKTGKRNLY